VQYAVRRFVSGLGQRLGPVKRCPAGGVTLERRRARATTRRNSISNGTAHACRVKSLPTERAQQGRLLSLDRFVRIVRQTGRWHEHLVEAEQSDEQVVKGNSMSSAALRLQRRDPPG
jgi:hypothetical protein